MRVQHICEIKCIKFALHENRFKLLLLKQTNGDIMKLLQDHIDKKFNGNISHFAESYGESRQQVQRWLKKDAMWQNNQVYLEPAKHNRDK